MNQEDNEYLTRVGPDTPMGNLLRRYWMPVMLESEVPGPNMPPVASRVMGEDCLVWRDANAMACVASFMDGSSAHPARFWRFPTSRIRS